MPFDPLTLAKDVGMSAEDQAAIGALFTRYPTAATQLETAITREVDARLTTAQQELATRKQELDRQFDTIATVREGDSNTLRLAEERAETLAAQVAVAENRIRRIATETGVDPAPYLKDLTVVAKLADPTAPVVKPLDQNQVLDQAGRFAWNGVLAAADLEDMAAEYQTLYGKPLPNRRELLTTLQEKVKRTGDASITLRQVFEETHKIPEKRAELAEADVQRRITEARAAGAREAQDAAALGSAAAQTSQFVSQSPIAAAIALDKTVTRVPGVPEGVVASIASYRAEMAKRRAS